MKNALVQRLAVPLLPLAFFLHPFALLPHSPACALAQDLAGSVEVEGEDGKADRPRLFVRVDRLNPDQNCRIIGTLRREMSSRDFASSSTTPMPVELEKDCSEMTFGMPKSSEVPKTPAEIAANPRESYRLLESSQAKINFLEGNSMGCSFQPNTNYTTVSDGETPCPVS